MGSETGEISPLALHSILGPARFSFWRSRGGDGFVVQWDVVHVWVDEGSDARFGPWELTSVFRASSSTFEMGCTGGMHFMFVSDYTTTTHYLPGAGPCKSDYGNDMA